jgi:hypothetical protein
MKKDTGNGKAVSKQRRKTSQGSQHFVFDGSTIIAVVELVPCLY